MSDTSVTTTPSTTPSTPPPLPNDAAARSPTGEILEPAQIAAQKPTTPETPEAKPGEPPAPTSTSKDPAKPEGAPTTYADFKAPDGYTIDPKTIEAAVPIFKEMGLTQDQAQKLVDFHTSQMIEAAKAPEATYTAMRNEWQAAAKADPEMSRHSIDGKTGLDAVKIDMARALNALGDPKLASDFKAAMDLTGAGDNPAFIKTFWKLSQYITEGKHVGGTGPSVHGQRPPGTNERPSAAAALYPNLPR